MSEAEVQRIIGRVAWLKKEADKLAVVKTEMDRTGADQISETDPDARSMAITSRHPRIIGYNVQSAVDTEHHLIVAHEVTNIGSDRNALSDMANQARDALDARKLDVVADKGYYKGEEIVACEDDDITVTLPKPNDIECQGAMAGSIAARSSLTPKGTCMFARQVSISHLA